MNIRTGMVLVSTCDESPLNGMYRVLQVLKDENLAVLIPIPTGPRMNKHGNPRNYYFKGFVSCSLAELIVWVDKKLLIRTTRSLPALWYMSDAAIRERFPPKKGCKESHVLSERERKWELIRPILPDQERTRFFSLMELEAKAGKHAIEAKVSKAQVLDALHRYYAFGCIRNALLPNKANCGAPTKPRIARNGKKLGRKNAAALVGNIALQGKILEEVDRQNLKDGWSLFVRPGSTVSEAFRAMTSTFYNKGYTEKFGVLVPDLLDAHLRPTDREFRYHGPLGEDDASASRRLMGEGEWLKNCRELQGSARSGVFAFGQVGVFDASPIDVNLVACFDCLRPIGVGRGIFLTDSKFDLIVGWHVAIGGLGANDALMAILTGALDKSEILARYDLSKLPLEDFPFIVFSKYLGDNGELRCIAGIEAIVGDIGSRLEFIKTGRADQNSVAESGHHSRHRGLDHKLLGTNHGRQKRRGEELPITKGVWTKYQYERLLILWIHWRNTKQLVPHMLTAEMRRDKVEPTRIAIYRWALKKGYVAGIPKEPTFLRSRLLPTFTASIQRNGLVLHRPNNGNAVELLRGALFSDPYLAASGLIRTALNGGKKHIEVKANPDDLSCVYLFDANGTHVINNVTNDPILVREGCISDLGAIKDADRLEKIETASQRDQDEADMRAFRVEPEEEAKRKKSAALSKLGKTHSKAKTDRSSVRENQGLEKRAQLDAAADRASGKSSNSVQQVSNAKDVQRRNSKQAEVPDSPKVKGMAVLMQEKLMKFHNQRSTK